MNHHAYIYEGALSGLAELAQEAREQFGFATEHSPDVHVREFEKFGIEESRWLTDTAGLRSSSGGALFVIGASSITSEAQQALLKLFEEPQQGSIFVLLLPHGALLPTLRSRMMVYEKQPAAQKKVLGSPRPAPLTKGSQARPDYFSVPPAVFLRASNKERSEYIAKLLKDDEGVKERVRDFINAIETELKPRIAEPKVREALQDVAMVRDYLADRSPSLKMLLEHLALSLPV